MLFKVLERTERITTGLALAVCVPLTIAIVGVAVVAIFFRYVLNDAIVSSFDVMILMFCWMVFLGLVVGEKDGAHLNLDVSRFFLSSGGERVATFLRHAVSAGLCAFVAFAGYELTRRTGMQIPSMRISQKWLYAPLPVGFALLCLSYCIRALKVVMPIAKEN